MTIFLHLGATISETLISDPTRIRAQLILSNHLLRGMDVFVTNEFDLRTRTNQFSFAGFEWANHNWNVSEDYYYYCPLLELFHFILVSFRSSARRRCIADLSSC